MKDDTAALLRALRAEHVIEYASTNYRAQAADLITTQAQHIAALEAALAAKDEATRAFIRAWDGEDISSSTFVLVDGMRAALLTTPPEALARREAERRVIEEADKIVEYRRRLTIMRDDARISFGLGLMPWLLDDGKASDTAAQLANILSGWHEQKKRADKADAVLAEMRPALERVKQYLYNGFEPDNQSSAYHDICALLSATENQIK